MQNTKKAAMFGLDARIALAIFGALSVISGVALYTVIQKAKATAMHQELIEFGKAWEAHLLDTGLDLPKYNAGSPNYRDLHGLIEDQGNFGWNGPYGNWKMHSIWTNTLHYSRFGGGLYLMSIKSDNSWGGAVNYTNGVCTNDIDCYLWIYTSVVKGSYFKKIDDIVDSGDGAASGSFRWVNMGDAYDTRIFLKYAPYGKPK